MVLLDGASVKLDAQKLLQSVLDVCCVMVEPSKDARADHFRSQCLKAIAPSVFQLGDGQPASTVGWVSSVMELMVAVLEQNYSCQIMLGAIEAGLPAVSCDTVEPLESTPVVEAQGTEDTECRRLAANMFGKRQLGLDVLLAKFLQHTQTLAHLTWGGQQLHQLGTSTNPTSQDCASAAATAKEPGALRATSALKQSLNVLTVDVAGSLRIRYGLQPVVGWIVHILVPLSGALLGAIQTLRHRATRTAGIYLADRAHEHLSAAAAAVKLHSSFILQAEAALVQQPDLNKCLEAIAIALGAAKMICSLFEPSFRCDMLCVYACYPKPFWE